MGAQICLVCGGSWGVVVFPKKNRSKVCSACARKYKYCPKCKQALPLHHFRRWKENTQVAPYCKECAHSRHSADFQKKKRDSIRYDQLKEYVKTYYKTEAGKISRSLAYWNRIARMAGHPGVSKKDWMEILERYGGRCVYCRAAGHMTIDHVKPVYAGGVHEKTNVVPSCRACNSGKHYKRVEELVDGYRQQLLIRIKDR